MTPDTTPATPATPSIPPTPTTAAFPVPLSVELKRVDQTTLDDLVARARATPRRRLNLNLHADLAEPIHRLANALEPDSYVRPHRHPDRWEMMTLLRGAFLLVLFEPDGRIRERLRLAADAAMVLEYPGGAWHSLLALETGSVFLEVKAGPYVPTRAEDWLPGTPAEGEEDVAAFVAFMREARLGERFARPPGSPGVRPSP